MRVAFLIVFAMMCGACTEEKKPDNAATAYAAALQEDLKNAQEAQEKMSRAIAESQKQVEQAQAADR